jgi:hypothetical protein
MTVTVITHPTEASTTEAHPSLWAPGLKAAVVAAAATTAVAVGAKALGVSLDSGGEPFPLLGFPQLTVVFAVVGLVIASVLRRSASRPRTTWMRTTVVLTTLSLVPDVLLDADVATKLTLMVAHLVAAAIVIPAVARRLPESATR